MGAMAKWTGTPFADVLAAAQDGDEEAFASLWRWLQPSLLRWLRVVAHDHVEDIASEVWLAVARNLERFVGDDSDFSGWLFTIGRRRAIDWSRRRGRQVEQSVLGSEDVADGSIGSERYVEDAAAAEAAVALLRTLTPDQAEVVALRVIVGMSVAEAAAVVGKSESAVRVLCHRGLRSLAAHLREADLTRGVTA